MALPGFIEKGLAKNLTREARLGSVLRGLGGMGLRGRGDRAAIREAERIGTAGAMGSFYRADNRLVRRGARRAGYTVGGGLVLGRASSGRHGMQGRSSGAGTTGMYGY